MISNERMEKALIYLAETDEEYAQAKATLEDELGKLKIIKAQVYLASLGSQGDRAEKAHNSTQFRDQHQKVVEATYAFEKLRNKRRTESIVIEAWRSLFSARKQGIIV